MMKKIYKDSKERKRFQNQRYYKRHRDVIYRCNKRYRQSLKGKYNQFLKDCKRKSISHDFKLEEWIEKLEETNGYCPNCKHYIGVDSLTIDHIIPVRAVPIGYIYTIEEVQPLCKSCNSSKGDRI